MLFELSTEIIILAGLILLLLVWVIRLEMRIHRLTRGGDGKSLEGTIRKIVDVQKSLEQFQSEAKQYLKSMETRLRHSIRGVATVRFDAFAGKGEGGRQSFATAFLDENGDGLVISSLYRRDNIGIFAKPVKNLKSTFELTREEEKAVEEARNTLVS